MGSYNYRLVTRNNLTDLEYQVRYLERRGWRLCMHDDTSITIMEALNETSAYKVMPEGAEVSIGIPKMLVVKMRKEIPPAEWTETIQVSEETAAPSSSESS